LDTVECEPVKPLKSIIEKYEEDMRQGRLEGVILTVQTSEGFRLYKWKGPQELQPATNSQFLAANKRIQASSPSEISDNIKNIFAKLAAVITDVSQNTPAQRRMSKSVRGERNTPASRGDNVRSRTRYLTTIDKEIIMAGIESALLKYDSLEVYVARNKLDEYTAALVEEVTQHLVEEVVEYEGLDQDSTAAHFIRAKVSQTIRDKLASLDVADKKQINKKTTL